VEAKFRRTYMCGDGAWTPFWSEREMIRFLVIAAVVILVWFLLLQLFKQVSSKPIDWRGMLLAAGFVALAFYLSHVTGIAGL